MARPDGGYAIKPRYEIEWFPIPGGCMWRVVLAGRILFEAPSRNECWRWIVKHPSSDLANARWGEPAPIPMGGA